MHGLMQRLNHAQMNAVLAGVMGPIQGGVRKSMNGRKDMPTSTTYT